MVGPLVVAVRHVVGAEVEIGETPVLRTAGEGRAIGDTLALPAAGDIEQMPLDNGQVTLNSTCIAGADVGRDEALIVGPVGAGVNAGFAVVAGVVWT